MDHARFEQVVARIHAVDPTLSPEFSLEFGDAVVAIDRERVLSICRGLHDAGFEFLGMVTVVDRRDDLLVVYRLKSRSMSASIYVKVPVPHHDPTIDSVVSVWPAANWQEREAYDLFGVVFTGHPDLRRIMLSDDFEGHPLLKSYSSDRVVSRPQRF